MGKFISQTEMANEFFLNSVTFGNKLIKMGLKDEETKLATEKAFKKKYAKNVEYGDKKMSIWSRILIEIIKNNMSRDEEFCINVIVGFFSTIKKISKEDDGTKIYVITYDYLYENFDEIYKKIKINEQMKEKILFATKKKGVQDLYINYLNDIY